jgi:4-nitrophenyl phosphatase
MFEFSLQKLGTKPLETLVVGDRLDTDIAGGQAAGCRTALVLSGVTSSAQAAAWSPKLDLIAPTAADLV